VVFLAAFFFLAIQSHLLSLQSILREPTRHHPYFRFFFLLGAAFFVAFLVVFFFLLAAIQSHPLSSQVIPRDAVRGTGRTL
jgi:hypothetical protein